MSNKILFGKLAGDMHVLYMDRQNLRSKEITMKKHTYLIAVATVFASSLFAAGCSSDRAQQQRETVVYSDPAPMADQQEQQTPPAPAMDSADLGAASSGRGR
jgi:hypothetical protein